jgi:hypothetical protein
VPNICAELVGSEEFAVSETVNRVVQVRHFGRRVEGGGLEGKLVLCPELAPGRARLSA